MQLVIDIDENVFTRLFDNGVEDYEIANDDLSEIVKSIRKGMILPEGHSRLIDADLLNTCLENVQVNLGDELSDAFDDGLTWACEVLNNSPTILEAEKGAE